MIDIQNLDKESLDLLRDEKELLKLDPERVRSFYSLTGSARKDYIIQLAEAEAERIKIVRKAQAEGIFEILKAQAEGLKLIEKVLSESNVPEKIIQMATLIALQGVSRSLAEGKATKMFIPQNINDIFSIVGIIKEVLDLDKETQENKKEKNEINKNSK